MDKQVRDDLRELREYGIVFMTTNIEITGRDTKFYRFKKELKIKHQFKDIKCVEKSDLTHNSSMIPLGWRYNLIGVDVDNKFVGKYNKSDTVDPNKDEGYNTIDKYEEIMINNKLESTLTLKTINNGYHFYYRLNKDQENKLKELNFKSKNDALFNLNVDVKYDNQIFFGPSILKYEGSDWRYEIIVHKEPIIFPDILFNELINNLTEQIEKEVKEVKVIKEEVKEKNIKKTSNNTDLIKYLDCLNVKRFTDYESWLQIGSIIYNEDSTIEVFKKYSAKAKNYDEKSCEDKWNEFKKFKGKKMLIGTLIKMAKEDNPEMFNTIKYNSISNMVKNIVMNCHDDDTLSKIFFTLNTNNIVYEQSKNKWYILDKCNIWKEKTDLKIINMISKLLPIVLETEYKNMKIEKKSDESKNYNKAYKYCKNVTSQKNIVKRLKAMYYDDKFTEKVNNVNDLLFAFKNGVYDLKNGEFRLPLPEELISKTCSYDYVQEKNESKIKELEKLINEIFKKDEYDKKGEEIKEYVLTTVAQCLAGEICGENFNIWSGQGRNGKGVLRDLILATFDIYYDSMEISELDKLKPLSSNGVDINLANKRYSRIVVTTEPDSAMQLKANKIAQWTGGDPVTCRFNHDKTSFSYVPKWKLFIQTNYDLSFPGKNIKAFTERTNMVRFPFCFVSDNKMENEKEGDPLLKQKLKNPELRMAFFHILLEYYNKFVKNGKKITIPNTIKEETDMLFLTADPVTPFINNMIQKTGETTDFIASSELYNAFKEYYANKDIKLNVQEFKACMREKGFNPSVKNGRIIWRGIKLLPKIENAEFDDN